MQIISRRQAIRRATMALVCAPRLPPIVSTTEQEESPAVNVSADPAVTLQDLWPDRATYRPGAPVTLHVALTNRAASAQPVRLAVSVHWLDVLAGTGGRDVELAPGTHTVTLPLTVPATQFRGYGVDLSVLDSSGMLLARGSTALDVLDDWRQAPRYGFLSDFTPGDPFAAANVAMLARYHVNVVQFYDWMWRHYALMPPHDDFTDALGRDLSLRTVREKVAACAAHGMAALGYAAVYGAEPEYALNHPDEMLYDAAGTPYSLEKLFYIMNIHQGNPWRTRILAAMATAVREVPFDGLHLDQYGFPKDQAFGPPPARTLYDLSRDFPPFIDDARVAVRHARPGAGVIFNAVDNWPIESVAPTTQDATYIEVWPPYDGYSDLQTLMLEARHLAPTKQVILAAYLTPLLGAMGDALPPAQAATRLASAAIWANGGFHLLLGEGNGALCDPYYPKYATMMPDFIRVMRRYYDFVVRYENVLADRHLVTAAGSGSFAAATLAGAQASPLGEAGAIWTIARAMPGFSTLSLINLTGAVDANWNAPKPAPPVLHDLQVEFEVQGPVEAVFAASPDGDDDAAQALPFSTVAHAGARRVRVRLPRLEYWSLLVARVHES
jgi:dextranase